MAATTAGRRARRGALLVGLTLTTGLTSCAAAPGSRMSADGPIKVGTLYAGSGQFADSSGPEYAGLQFWAAHANAQGGLWVTALHRRKRVEVVAYDDHSSAAQAGVLYHRLVEQDHVDILVSDFGSVLTAPAIQVAQRDKVLLFDQTGSGAQFFNGQNPYIVLCDVPTSAVWPIPLTSFLIQQKLRRVALVYGDNYFDASQDQTIAAALTRVGTAPVLNVVVPTESSDYSGVLHAVTASRADAVIELGYQANDVAFLRQLHVKGGGHPPFVFTAFPGQLHKLLEQSVGSAALTGTFTYGFPPYVQHSVVNAGLTAAAFAQALNPQYPDTVSFLDVAGYNTGLIVQAALAGARTTGQLGLRTALSRLSGHLQTLEGTFRIDAQGAQIGEALPVAQIVPNGPESTTLRIVTPPKAVEGDRAQAAAALNPAALPDVRTSR